MITRKEAESIAAEVQGRPSDDEQRPWVLKEFDHGWLVVDSRPPDESRRGGASRVIERETGSFIQFPSSVPRRRIMSQYPSVRDRGHEVRRTDG